MTFQLLNLNKKITSLLVSELENVPAGDFNPGRDFLIKNITDDNITVTIKPTHNSEPIETVLYPGWNPEICSEILDAEANTLQIGR